SGSVIDPANIARDLVYTQCCLLGVTGNFLGRRRLLLDRSSDAGGDLVDAGDGGADVTHRVSRTPGYLLHAGNLNRNILSSLGCLAGQILDLRGNDREALAGFTGACRFDRGVKR